MKQRPTLAGLLVISAFGCAAPAAAADLRFKAPARAAFDWSGFYAGAHVGYGTGTLGPDANARLLLGTVLPPSVTGLLGGYQGGVLRQFGNGLVIGAEADATFASPPDQARATIRPYATTLDYVASLRGRLGYASGPDGTWLPYVTGGLAVAGSQLDIMDTAGDTLTRSRRTHLGWTAGVGVEAAIGGPWSARADYRYADFGSRDYSLASIGGGTLGLHPQIHTLTFGVNYHLWDTPSWAAPHAPRRVLPDATDWSIHGQVTFLPQAYPAFRSPYEGAYSLPGGGQGRETFTTTAFLGWRLWQGGEFYFNPELAQGFGLNSTLGIAGFPNGEAQKGGAPYPRFRAQRYYLRQTFGFGGEQEELSDAANQLPGKRDIDRVTVILGRFAVGDFFDGNAYAKDPRADFMNWSLWSSAAYDFPADLPGFTRGGVVELNRKDWAIRAGLFQVPTGQNSDILTFRDGGAVAEFEQRYQMFAQPGKFRVGVFANRATSGSFRGALALTAADPALDPNDAIAGLRRVRTKYGFYLNGEQQVAKDVGVFGRFSWNDGATETVSFTDIDRSLSAGVQVKGSYWGRPTDTIGIGGAVNGLSAAHRDFLAAGGLGLLIGDGRLTYATERILEAYYAYAVTTNFTATADYQLIVNPAYNADRGPVSVFSARLHAEF